MAVANFTIKWGTRPCVFHIGNNEIENGFWHMWHEYKSGILSGKVFGIVEDERGSINHVDCDNITFLDAEEKFAEYDWDLARKKSTDRFREYGRRYGIE
jgi:hypothetical protein